MRRAELEHVIRAAATVAEDRDLVVVGSQAILGQFPDAPEGMLVSREADVYPRGHPERQDEIEAALGDGSYFESTLGYYAHAVEPETAKVPAGWEQRLVPISNENTGGASGWCLEVHDLLLSKCAAGRERDWELAEEALLAGLAEADELRARLDDMPLAPEELERLRRRVEGIAPRAAKQDGP